MFAPMLAQSSRLAVRQAPMVARRGFAAAVKHGHNEMPAMPVETYPLLGVVIFGTGFGIYSSVHAWTKEKDAFVHHRSAGNPEMKY
ncbi:hypothetical protein CALCODRAFT_491500 [Calocera cornea HHB12733]|uniref:Uncharacterized protein n=1 Tax=Calocera cornea HHB12733 TaxID=1353952 RepID=A0A165IY37_9BASI|nr:hypothetical protein CALCODRAFT_491500 [Calocera cornea HHB12733]